MLRVFIVLLRWRGWVYGTTSSARGRGSPCRQSMWNCRLRSEPLHICMPLHGQTTNAQNKRRILREEGVTGCGSHDTVVKYHDCRTCSSDVRFSNG